MQTISAKCIQVFGDGHGRPMQRCPMICRGCRNDATIQQLTSEHVWCQGEDAERAQRGKWKIGGVECHNRVRSASQGCCQNMPIVPIWKSQPLLPALIAAYPTPTNVTVHEMTCSQQGGAQAWFSAKDGSNPLSMNPACPFCPHYALSAAVNRQSNQKVS